MTHCLSVLITNVELFKVLTMLNQEVNINQVKVPICIRVFDKEAIVWGGCIVGEMVSTGALVRSAGKVVSITPTVRDNVVTVITDDGREWLVAHQTSKEKREDILKRLLNTESIDIYLTRTSNEV